jgi:hypothetical protein
MIRWTGLAPSEFEFPFPGNPISTFLVDFIHSRRLSARDGHVRRGLLTRSSIYTSPDTSVHLYTDMSVYL